MPDRSCETDESPGIDLTQEEGRLNECQVGNGVDVGNASMRCKGVRGFGSALLGCELAWDGARGFGSVSLRCKLVWDEKRCSGMVLKTWEQHRQVGIGSIGVGVVTVVIGSVYTSYTQHMGSRCTHRAVHHPGTENKTNICYTYAT